MCVVRGALYTAVIRTYDRGTRGDFYFPRINLCLSLSHAHTLSVDYRSEFRLRRGGRFSFFVSASCVVDGHIRYPFSSSFSSSSSSSSFSSSRRLVEIRLIVGNKVTALSVLASPARLVNGRRRRDTWNVHPEPDKNNNNRRPRFLSETDLLLCVFVPHTERLSTSNIIAVF